MLVRAVTPSFGADAVGSTIDDATRTIDEDSRTSYLYTNLAIGAASASRSAAVIALAMICAARGARSAGCDV